MKLIARTKLDNGEIAYTSDPQKLYEVKEKLYRYERVADEPEKVVAIDKVLEIIDKHGQQLISDIIDCKFQEIIAADVLASVREDVLALKGEQE